MDFIYKAKDSKGEEKVGKIQARSEDLAIQLLQGYGLTVYDLKTSGEQGIFDKFFGRRRRASSKELSLFLRQFATLLSSKVPLMDSLKTLITQTSSSGVKDMIFDLISGLDAGLSLSQSMARGESIFSAFYIEMVKSGEISGRLEEVFIYLADYAENEASLNTKAKSAMIYPAFIISVFVLVGAIISITVAPQMMDIFQEFGQNPPFLTKMLIGFGQFLLNWGILVLVGIGGLVFALINYLKTPEGQNLWAFWSMKVPIIGNIFKAIYLSRFAESFGTLLHGGIPVVQAIEVAGSATGNFVFEQMGHAIAEGVRRGEPISKILQEFPDYFPPLVSQMVFVGENTGKLDSLLKRISIYYFNEVENGFKILLELIQPVLIVIIAVLVGVLIAGVLLPIYQLAQAV